jgi:peptidase C39-like protein
MRGRRLVVIGVLVALQAAAPPAQAKEWEHWPGEWNPGRPSLAASLRSAAPMSASRYWIDSPVFRLDVPFRTQKDGGQWQTSNCGPAALGMVLDGFGIVGQPTDDLRFRSHTYQGTVGMRTGTALQHVARVAEDFGLSAHGLYNAAGEFSRWSLDDIRGQLRQGRPVMPLVRLYLLPGHEGVGTRWGHYILLTGISEDGFFYNDPLKPSAAEGMGRRISAEQLERAMANSHIPGQAVAFGAPGSVSPRVINP